MKRIFLVVITFVVMISGCSSHPGPAKKEMSEKERDLLLSKIEENLMASKTYTISAGNVKIIEHVSYPDFTKKIQVHVYGGYVPIRVSIISTETGKEINPVFNVYFQCSTFECIKQDASNPGFLPGEYKMARFFYEITEQGARPEDDAKIVEKIQVLMRDAKQHAERVAQK